MRKNMIVIAARFSNLITFATSRKGIGNTY